LGIDNEFFFTCDESEETQEKENIDQLRANTCFVCGMGATKKCGDCSHAWYCSREHQILHWCHGHKEICSHEKSDNFEELKVSSLKKLEKYGSLFPEMEIISEPEQLEIDLPKHSSTSLIPVPNPSCTDDAEDLEDTETGVDSAFLTFQQRMELNPGHVLRYLRVDDSVEPEPLFVSNLAVSNASKVASCELCGSPRTLECQILSTLLNFIPGTMSESDCFDFGTYFVWSCPHNCALNGSYAEEIILQQSYSSDGMTPLSKRFESVQEALCREGIET
jgi:pre-rRNA-processing protein TSR4